MLSARRMCRDFDPSPLPEATAATLVEAATRAPAAGNTHGLEFLVLEGSDTAGYWDVTLAPGRREGFRWPGLLRAPLLLIPYVEPGAWARRYSEPDKAASGLGSPESWPVPYWYVDGGAAVMAVLLAAEDLGLGALLFGQFGKEAAIRESFGVPDGHRALGTIAVGRPAKGASSRSASAARGRPVVDSITHRRRW